MLSAMCTLRIHGADLDPDALLRAIPLRAAAIHRRGEPRLPSKPQGACHETSNINVAVSNAEFSDLPGQIADVRTFVREHAESLRAARSYDRVSGMVFDFPIALRDVAVHCERLPAALLAEVGALGIDLEISIYPEPDDT